MFAEGLQNMQDAAKDDIKKTENSIRHETQCTDVQDRQQGFEVAYNRRRDTRMGEKLLPRYSGPYEIHEILGRGVYRLKDGDNILKQTVNATNLKLWLDRSPNLSPSSSPRLPQSDAKRVCRDKSSLATSTGSARRRIIVDDSTDSEVTG